MQTIVGSGGAIGTQLAKSLTEFTDEIRLVSRNPKKVNENDILLPLDLLNAKDVDTAVKGSSVVYVTVGFPYNLKTWSNSWPSFIQNVIDACIAHQSKLVFFDNIYMYDKNHLNGMNEETPNNPPSKKGKIREEVANRVMDAVSSGKLKALIARAADFYGPGIKQTSMLTEMVFKPLSENKTANWMSSLNYKHSFTYTPDAGRATALLGNSENAYDQIWHLPTADNPYTGGEWIEMIAKELGAKPKSRVATAFILKLMGIFVPVLREMPEMMYQYDRDYVFNSDKFLKQFDFSVTPYLEGIRHVIQSDYRE